MRPIIRGRKTERLRNTERQTGDIIQNIYGNLFSKEKANNTRKLYIKLSERKQDEKGLK